MYVTPSFSCANLFKWWVESEASEREDFWGVLLCICFVKPWLLLVARHSFRNRETHAKSRYPANTQPRVSEVRMRHILLLYTYAIACVHVAPDYKYQPRAPTTGDALESTPSVLRCAYSEATECQDPSHQQAASFKSHAKFPSENFISALLPIRSLHWLVPTNLRSLEAQFLKHQFNRVTEEVFVSFPCILACCLTHDRNDPACPTHWNLVGQQVSDRSTHKAKLFPLLLILL